MKFDVLCIIGQFNSNIKITGRQNAVIFRNKIALSVSNTVILLNSKIPTVNRDITKITFSHTRAALIDFDAD